MDHERASSPDIIERRIDEFLKKEIVYAVKLEDYLNDLRFFKKSQKFLHHKKMKKR